MRPPVFLSFGHAKSAPSDAIVIDYRSHRFWKNGETYKSAANRTTYRFKLFAALICCPGRITHDEIYEAVWGDDPEGGPLSLGNIICVMSYTTVLLSTRRVRMCKWLGFNVSSYQETVNVTWPDDERAAA